MKIHKNIITIFALVISMAFPFTLHADEGNASLERSTKAVAQAKEELEQERIRISKEEERLKELVNKLRSERDKLSDAVIDLKISVKRQKESQSDIEKNVNSLKDNVRDKEEVLNQVHTLLSGAAGELNGLVKTLPPSSSRQQQIVMLNKLIDNSEPDTKETSVEDTKLLFKTVLEVINEGQDIELYTSQVKTEDGVLEESDIMRIGHIATAYVSHDIGRVGLLIKSIEGDEGFRWRENLPRNQRKKIMHAFNAMKNHEEGTFAFPVDVTQEIQLQKKSGSSGVFGFLVSGGPVMIPLAIVTLVALILIIERLFFFRKERSMHAHLMGDIISLCAEGRYDEAEDICKQHEGPIARTLAACISRREQGVSAMEDSVQESIMHEIPIPACNWRTGGGRPFIRPPGHGYRYDQYIPYDYYLWQRQSRADGGRHLSGADYDCYRSRNRYPGSPCAQCSINKSRRNYLRHRKICGNCFKCVSESRRLRSKGGKRSLEVNIRQKDNRIS